MSKSEQWDKKRVVLDTNIIVSALLSGKGRPGEILDLFLAEELKLYYSEEIFNEYSDVLYRPYLRIPVSEATDTLAIIRQHGEKVMVEPSIDRMVDEDDRVFYDTAKIAGAYLITGNTRHYPSEPFILTPISFLELLKTDNL
jgi:putative PIN family toxin of toxin-antitoxin system